MNNKYSKYCIALNKNGKRCKKYPTLDSNVCSVHCDYDEHQLIIPEQRGWCILYAMYVMFLLHMCLFVYTVHNFPSDQ